MKVNFKGIFEIKPQEWLYIAVFVVIVCLVIKGRMDEALQFLKDCLPLMKK